MKEINATISFGAAKNAQHFEVHGKILTYISDDFAAEYGFSAKLQKYKDLYAIEAGIFSPNKAFYETSEVVTLDDRRDRGALYLTNRARTAEYSLDEEEAEAGRLLTYAMTPYALGYTKDYDSNSALLRQLIATLRKPEYAAAVAKLGLTPGIDAAEDANDAFGTVYETRYKEYLTRISTETMKSIRPQVDGGAHDTFKAINALYLVNEMTTQDPQVQAALGEVIDNINGRLAWFERVLDGTAEGDADNTPDTDGGTTPDNGGSDPDNGGGSDDPTPDPNPGDGGGETPDPTPGGGGGTDDDEEVVG